MKEINLKHPRDKGRRLPTAPAPSGRYAALTIVDMVLQSDKEQATDWLDQHFKRNSVAWRDRAFITELVYGTLRRMLTLDWILSHYTFHRVKDHWLKNILRLGVYQIYFLDKVPNYAVVNEMVQIAKDKLGDAKGRFVNAVLRRATTNELPLDEKGIAKKEGCDALRAISIAHAMPQWILERWKKTYSVEEIRQICVAANATPALFIRVNTRKTNAADLQKLLREEGAEVENAINPTLLKMRPPKSIESLATFRDGLFYVQDPTTLRVVDFMHPKPGEKILDFCAAPGGKTFYLEEKTGDAANIVAAEKNPTRLRIAMDNARRLGSQVLWIPAETPRVEVHGKFDKILVDAPCSNQGVLGRRVEARWRLAPEKIEKLSMLQKEILEQALGFVDDQGAIFYSTCSIDQEENQGVVKDFLKKHRKWVCAGELSILPQAGEHDGGFVAKLVKKND